MTKDDLISLVKKNPIGIGCGLLSLALGGVIYFRSGELPAAEEDLAQKSAESARLSANIQNAAQLKEQFEAVAAASKEVDARLVHASQTLNNYQYFYKLESETGAKMLAGSPSQGAIASAKAGPKAAFVPVPFTITVQGTLAQMLGYLRHLESGARYCRVMTVTCSVPATDRNAVTLALTLELLGVP